MSILVTPVGFSSNSFRASKMLPSRIARAARITQFGGSFSRWGSSSRGQGGISRTAAIAAEKTEKATAAKQQMSRNRVIKNQALPPKQQLNPDNPYLNPRWGTRLFRSQRRASTRWSAFLVFFLPRASRLLWRARGHNEHGLDGCCRSGYCR